jgi:hypothetical protein
MLMQRLNTWLKMAALVALYSMVQPTRLHAQNDILKKPVKAKKIDHQRLEAVLEELSKEGYFTFSYNSSIVDKDRLVTLTLRESTLRSALTNILGPGYALESEDDYVVVRKTNWKKLPADPSMRGPWKGMPPPKMNKGPWIGERGPKMNRGPWKDSLKVKIKQRQYESDTARFEAMKQTALNIIAEMVSEKVIRDKDSFQWFGLDNNQFVVDGKPVADSVRVKFQAKFIKPDGLGYYYGPVSIHGRGFFFDRKDIYGSPQ